MENEKIYINSEKDLPKETGIYLAYYFDVWSGQYKTGEILFDLTPNVTWVNWALQVKWYINSKIEYDKKSM